MATSNYTTIITVDRPINEVFATINNVRGWWQGEIEGSTDKLDDVFSYRMKDIHYSKQQIVEMIPNEKIVWLVIDSKLTFTSNKSEWTGTKIIFELFDMEHQTQVRFTNFGLVPEFECYGGCSNGWKMLIQESLVSLIETGKGVNVFG